MDVKLKDAQIVICTPFRAVHEAFSPYIRSLVATLKLCRLAGVEADYWEVTGDSYVWRVRNGFAHKFLHESKAKYMIFIDSDHAWDVIGFSNLLKAPVDVVGAAYPCKNNWDFWSVSHHVNDDELKTPKMDPVTGLISATEVPTGFMKISRKALETIITQEPDNFYLNDKGEKVHGFFNHIVENGTAFGEDISFCVRCHRAGIPLWIEPDITVSHFGTEQHVGNYWEFLLRQPGGSKFVSWESKITALKGKHAGETAWIIGKGPSLAHLKAEDFGPGPIITLNEAINGIEQMELDNEVYSIQKDYGWDGDGCTRPSRATLLLHEHESSGYMPDYKPRYIFDNPVDFNMPWNTCSAVTAIEIARLLGCTKLKLVSFDACVNGNAETCTHATDGTYKIEKLYDGNYEHQAIGMKQHLHNHPIEYEWITPEGERQDG